MKYIRVSTYLHLARAIIHHAVLGSHGFVGVQTACVKGDLLHFGNSPNSVGFPWASGLILILPVAEELFKQCGLPASGQHLDLITNDQEMLKIKLRLDVDRFELQGAQIGFLPECF